MLNIFNFLDKNECEDRDKLVIDKLTKITSYILLQNKMISRLWLLNKTTKEEIEMKLNDLKTDVKDLGDLLSKVAVEIETQVASLEKAFEEAQALNDNPEVPQEIVDGLNKIRAIGEALDAMNPDVVVPAEEAPVEVVEEVLVEEAPVEVLPEEQVLVETETQVEEAPVEVAEEVVITEEARIDPEAQV